MADVHTKEVRSYNMSQIKGRNTKPELLVRKFLFSNGLRFRLHDKNLAGRPDIVLPKYKTVIFVNGCFWHKHNGCRFFVVPKTRTDFWMNKINKNVENDVKAVKELENKGWRVIILWECELKPKVLQKTLEDLLEILQSSNYEHK